MSALDFMDCSAPGALLRVQGLARRGGGDVVLAAPQRLVLRLLALTGKDEVLWVHASVEAAVASAAIAYCYRVIAAAAAADLAGPLRGRMGRGLIAGPWCGGRWPRRPPCTAAGYRLPTSARSRSAQLSWAGGGWLPRAASARIS
jgi:hypothetical protein